MNDAQMIGTVVIALGVLVGLFFTVAKPMIENQKITTELTCAIRELTNKLLALEENNTDSHRRIFKKVDEQDHLLQNHETRIHDLEMKQ